MACPRCRRHGGMLKPQGRLGNKLLAAKLLYRATGVARRWLTRTSRCSARINPINFPIWLSARSYYYSKGDPAG